MSGFYSAAAQTKTFLPQAFYSKSTALVQECLGSRKTSARKPETVPGVLSWEPLKVTHPKWGQLAVSAALNSGVC